MEGLTLVRVRPPTFHVLVASADCSCAVRTYEVEMARLQGSVRFVHVTLTSNGVLIVQLEPVVVLVTPEGTVPPKACIEPKDILAEFVPEPPRANPLASDCNVKLSEHTTGKH